MTASNGGSYYGLSSTGWSRDAAGTNLITPQRVYYTTAVSPMSSVSGSWGQPGTSGACRTVAAEVDASDPNVPGISAGGQASLVRIVDSQATNPFWGTRPSPLPQQGETWWYGFANQTNAGYVPHGWTTTDLTFGNWNAFGFQYHSAIGPGGVGVLGQNVATIGPANGGDAGPNQSIWYACNQTMSKLAQPRLEIGLTAGLNDATKNDATHTCLRFQGPVFVAGRLYKEIYQVHWDAFQHGSFSWWVDDGDGRGYVQYAAMSGVSTLMRDSAGNVDTGTYPQMLNYRKSDTSLPASVMYYGGFIRGSSMSDVVIP